MFAANSTAVLRHWAAEDVAWDARAMAVSTVDVSGINEVSPAPPSSPDDRSAELEAAAEPRGEAGGALAPRASGGARSRVKRAAALKTCQVPHCGVELDTASHRAYNLRYRLCMAHLRADAVEMEGQPMRFCQKCSRFEPVALFRGTTHTCRKMLARHNQLRLVASRRGGPGAGTEPQPSGTTRSGSGNSSDVGLLDAPGALEALLRDSDALDAFLDTLPVDPSPQGGPGTDAAFAAALLRFPPGGTSNPPPRAVQPPGEQMPPQWRVEDLAALQAAAAPAPPPAEAPRVNPLLQVVVSHIKLHDIAPCDLPRGLAELVRTWLGPFVLDALAYVRPGCTLLTVHALVPSAEAAEEARGAAAELAATLAAVAPPRVGLSRFEVHDSAGRVARADGGVVVDAGAPAAQQPRDGLPPLRPLALCSARPGVLTAAAPAPAAGALRAYCGGAMMPLPPAAERVAAGEPLSIPLGACGLDGVVLFELDQGAGGGVPPVRQRLRPVLLCRDAAVAAEVASLADTCDDDEAESVVLAVGHALSPAAPAAVVALAARLAVQRRWHATLARLLPALIAAGGTPSLETAPQDTLLHEAARSGDARLVAAVVAAGGACGRAASRGVGGATPMHIAAMAADAGARQAMLSAMCAADAEAPLGWFGARDAGGRTPAKLAAAAGGGGAVAAALRDRLLAARAAAVAALRRARDEQGVFEPRHAMDVAAAALAAAGTGQLARDAVAILTAAEEQVPDFPPEEAALSLWARGREVAAELRASGLRMPGAFADPALERDWLGATAARCWLHDACVFALCGLIHLVEMARLTPPESNRQLGAKLLYCFVLLAALPALIVLRSAWFMRHREAVITVSRLAAAAAAPVWLRRGTPATAPGYSGGWLSRFPLLFLAVRLPLHVVLSVASFTLTLSAGNSGRLGMRVSCAVIDIVIKAWFERASRAHFLAVRAAARAAKAKGLKGE